MTPSREPGPAASRCSANPTDSFFSPRIKKQKIYVSLERRGGGEKVNTQRAQGL